MKSTHGLLGLLLRARLPWGLRHGKVGTFWLSNHEPQGKPHIPSLQGYHRGQPRLHFFHVVKRTFIIGFEMAEEGHQGSNNVCS